MSTSTDPEATATPNVSRAYAAIEALFDGARSDNTAIKNDSIKALEIMANQLKGDLLTHLVSRAAAQINEVRSDELRKAILHNGTNEDIVAMLQSNFEADNIDASEALIRSLADDNWRVKAGATVQSVKLTWSNRKPREEDPAELELLTQLSTSTVAQARAVVFAVDGPSLEGFLDRLQNLAFVEADHKTSVFLEASIDAISGITNTYISAGPYKETVVKWREAICSIAALTDDKGIQTLAVERTLNPKTLSYLAESSIFPDVKSRAGERSVTLERMNAVKEAAGDQWGSLY